MENKTDIEKMASELSQGYNKCSYDGCPFRGNEKFLYIGCVECKIIHKLYNAGYGDVKQVVKEILQEIESRYWDGIDSNGDIGGREHNDTIKSLSAFIKQKYGVEVE